MQNYYFFIYSVELFSNSEQLLKAVITIIESTIRFFFIWFYGLKVLWFKGLPSSYFSTL